jgi:hypothetical protein
MNSTLTVQSRSAYTLRLRVDSSSTVLLRTANGTYERLIPGESAFVSRSDGARESRLVDMVVRFAAIGERGALTAEVLTAPLDQ